MTKLFPGILLLLSLQNIAMAQGNNPDNFVRLPPAINSESEELMPLMHPDGNEIYFSRVFHSDNYGGEYGGSDIWISKINANGEYEEAYRLPKPINNKDNNFVIGFSADGQRMYLNNTYKNSKKYAVAVSSLSGEQWSSPVPVEFELPPHEGPIGMYMHPSEKILLISMNADDSYGKEDLYVSIKDDSELWSRPENLGATINTSGYEISPFLSDDGKTLYFSSEGHEGYGSADIFKAVKKYNVWNVWDKLQNLGPDINTRKFEGYCSIYDNSMIYISNYNNKFCDILSYDLNNLNDSTIVKVNQLLQEAKDLIKREQD